MSEVGGDSDWEIILFRSCVRAVWFAGGSRAQMNGGDFLFSLLSRRAQIENRKSKIENRKSKIENRKSKIENRKSKIEKSKIENRKPNIETSEIAKL
jgi:multidrug resistance efflux pump